jgi:hypothetical protein
VGGTRRHRDFDLSLHNVWDNVWISRTSAAMVSVFPDWRVDRRRQE